QGVRRGGVDARRAGGGQGQRPRGNERVGEHVPRTRSPGPQRKRRRREEEVDDGVQEPAGEAERGRRSGRDGEEFADRPVRPSGGGERVLELEGSAGRLARDEGTV